MPTEYDATRTWPCKSLWTGKGDNRKPHPQAVEALNYLHEWKIIRGTYKGNAHASATTLPNALRRHLPNVPGLSGKGTRGKIGEWQNAVRGAMKANAPEAPAAVETVTITGDDAAAYAEWKASQNA